MKKSALAFVAFIVVACGGGGGSDQPVNTGNDSTTKPKVDPKSDQGNKDAELKKLAAAREEITSGEVKSGNCEDAHKAALEKAMGAIEDAVKAKNGDDGKPIGFTTVDKRVTVFGPDPRNVQIKVSGRGTEVHVLAFAPEMLSLDLEHEGRAATVRSPMAAEMAGKSADEHPKFGKAELQVDSRIVDTKAGDTLQIKVRGQGCGILMAFMKP